MLNFQQVKRQDVALQRLIATPIMTAIALWWLFIGVYSVAEVVTTDQTMSRFLETFPRPAAILIGAGFIIGAVITLWAMFTRYTRVDVIWKLHKVGYSAIMVSGGTYTYIAVAQEHYELLIVSLGAFHMIIGLAGLVSVTIYELMIRRMLNAQNNDA